MNKKGSVVLTVVMGFAIMIFGFLFVGIMQEQEALVQNVTMSNGDTTLPGLSCGSESNPNLTISDGQKVSCLITEAVNPYFIVIVLGIIGGLVAGRFLGK